MRKILGNPARWVAGLAILAVALVPATAGCGRNKPGTLLEPTGIQPPPSVWPGRLVGAVFFDPLNTPDLSGPPFPPTEVELIRDSSLVVSLHWGADSLEAQSRYFAFANLPPDTYEVVVRSSFFTTRSRTGLVVRDETLDAGNVTLPVNVLASSSNVDIIGTMPGFGIDQFGMGTTSLDQNTLGVWTFPNLLMPDLLPIPVIPAGTYRLKFVTDQSSSGANLIGWGGDPSDTLTVPITNHLTKRGNSPTTDLVIRFPVTGSYAFTLDERRQRFAVALLPPAPTSRSRRAP